MQKFLSDWIDFLELPPQVSAHLLFLHCCIIREIAPAPETMGKWKCYKQQVQKKWVEILARKITVTVRCANYSSDLTKCKQYPSLIRFQVGGAASQPVSIYQDNEQVKLWVAGVVYCRCASVAQSVKCMKISSNKRVSSRVVLQMTKTFTWQTVTLSCLLWKLNIKYEDQIKYATHIGRAEECKLYANIYLKGTSGGFTFAKIEHI